MNGSNVSQTPMEETAESLAEASPGILFPRMIETIHWNRQRKNHRRQLEHDRASHAALLRGDKPPEWSLHDERDEDNDMGDTYSITGDTTHHHHYAAAAEQASTEQVVASQEPSNASTPSGTVADLLKKAAIIAGLVGAGASIPTAVSVLSSTDTEPAVQTAPVTPAVDTDTISRLEIDRDQ